MNPVEWAQYEIFGNSLLIWAAGAGVFLLVWAALLLARRLLRGRLDKLRKNRDLTALEVTFHVVTSTKPLFLFFLAVFIGSRFWTLPDSVDVFLDKLIVIVFILQGGAWLISALLTTIAEKREEDLEHNREGVAAMDILSFIARVVVWSLVLLLVLDNLGVDITALVAGLGVGGIAVALAAQNILGDLFASLSIVLDKPFVVGDFLIINEYLGSVEKVGIKTTRLRSLSGEQLVFSNNDLLNSRVRNYGRMFERRVVFSIGVTYQTSAEKVKKIPPMIRSIVDAKEQVRFDRAHFAKYGDFALIFEVVYYVLSPEYNVYMDIQQAVNLEILEQFEQEDIEFAYPTQTVFLNQASKSPA